MKMSLLRTQALVEGTLMAVFTVILGLVGLYLPFFKVGIDMFLAVPIIIVIVRHGILAGCLSVGFAGALFFLLLGPFFSLPLFLQSGVLALFYGFALKKRLQPGITVLIGTVIVIISILLNLALTYTILGADTIDFGKRIQQNIDTTLELYREQGFFSTQYGFTEERARELLENTKRMLILLVPGILVIWALVTALINYLAAHRFLMRLKVSGSALPAFREWRLPWWVIWGFIIGFASYLVGDRLANQTLLTIGMNIMLIYAPVFFTLGLAVIVFYIGRYFAGLGFRIIAITFFIFFFRAVSIALVITGILDLLFNYRHLPGNS